MRILDFSDQFESNESFEGTAIPSTTVSHNDKTLKQHLDSLSGLIGSASSNDFLNIVGTKSPIQSQIDSLNIDSVECLSMGGQVLTRGVLSKIVFKNDIDTQNLFLNSKIGKINIKKKGRFKITLILNFESSGDLASVESQILKNGNEEVGFSQTTNAFFATGGTIQTLFVIAISNCNDNDYFDLNVRLSVSDNLVMSRIQSRSKVLIERIGDV